MENSVRVVRAAIPDILLLEPVKHGDARGFFSETYRRSALAEHGVDVDFVQDNHSRSAARGTVRGLHFQKPPRAQGKLVRATRGAVLDVSVDIRRGSPTFGQHVAVRIGEEEWNQVYIPPGFAHGFCTLEPDTEVLYKVTDYYSPEHDAGLRWDDPALGIEWPVGADVATLSDKDTKHPLLADLVLCFEYRGGA